MGSEDIIIELKELSHKNEITKYELIKLLKKYARTISAYDLMTVTARIRKDYEFIHTNYREKYLEIYMKNFIIRIKEILDNNNSLPSAINKNSFNTSLPMLERTYEKEREEIQTKNDKTPLIYVITSLYTTFILKEPIHPVGSEFPGNLKVEEKNGKFYCPVKDKQKDNINAICHLCLAEQTPIFKS